MRALLRLLGALHARGFHPAVVAGFVMMPLVAAVGIVTDRPAPHPTASAQPLRGSLDADAAPDSGTRRF